MALSRDPSILILGHSFVKRLNRDLRADFDIRAALDFKLRGTALVRLHGVGGRTVDKLQSFDLQVVRNLSPDVIILEIGTNDLSFSKPEVVGSAIEDLVVLFLQQFSVRVVGVCHVIPRGRTNANALSFFNQSRVLHQYLEVVLAPFPNVFCWHHKPFTHPDKPFYLPDGVHLNPAGQYLLYRSYRGAIMYGLSLL